MGLTITSRPQRDLYTTNPPTAYDQSYYNSRWVSGHLPIQYKISNTKNPVNSEDDIDSICAVSDAAGFAEINLCGTYETYVAYEYIEITDCTNSDYNGVWQILEVVNATTLKISASYSGDGTGLLQRYYNNYFNLIKVYAGIPQYHQYESEDQMSLVATLKIAPNSSNISIADISGLIQSKLNCDNDLDQISFPNDLNAWTGFYIEYAESYDVSDGSDISTHTSSYTLDNNDNCETTNVILNGDFASDLTSWTNGSTGQDWVWNSNRAESTGAGGLSRSKVLYQEVNFIQGIEYNIQLTATNNESNALTIVVALFSDTTLAPFGVIHSNSLSNGTTDISFNYIPQQDFTVIGFAAYFSGTSSQVASIDNISATISDCTYYGFAINGTRQFQNTIGGNFGDYVQNYNFDAYENKFLTVFDQPIYFDSLYFDISTIIPKSTFNNTEDGSLLYSINEYTESGGFIQRQDISLSSKDDGVYRLELSDLTLDSSTGYFTIQLYQLPSNKFTAGDRGTFEYTADSAGNPPSDWGIAKVDAISVVRYSTYKRTGSYGLFTSVSSSLFPAGENVLWRTNNSPEVQQNSDYIIEGYILNASLGATFYGNEIYLIPYTSGMTYTIIESYTITTPSTSVFNYIKVLVNTGSNTTIDLKAVMYLNSSISAASGGMVFDDISIKGPIENLSEIKTIKVDTVCSRQNIYLTWLNNLGAWEYFNFKAEKDYSIDISDSKSITRDVFNNWDTDFINGETQDDWFNINASETVVVRSQFVTESQIQALKSIKYSIRVQQIRSDGSKVTVIVDKKSFKYASDGDKLYSIEFEIKYPKIQIQGQ